MATRKRRKSRSSAAQKVSPLRRNRASAHIPVEPAARQPRQQRALGTVQAIVEAAGQLLVERGYAKTTTNAIAQRAGVSIGSLYQYFHDKDAVFVALCARHFERIEPLVVALMQAVKLPRCDIAAELAKFVDALVRVHEPERDVIRAIDNELGWLQARDAKGADEHGHWVDQIAGVLAERQTKVRDPLASAHLLVAAVESLSRWLAHSAPAGVDRQQLIAGLERMVNGLLGIAPASRRTPRSSTTRALDENSGRRR